MSERRQYTRLTIPLPVRLKTLNIEKEMVLDLAVKDISYTGTFIPTLTSFTEGTRFIMDFTHPSDKLKDFNEIKKLKGCSGTLVRSDSHGVAIQFDKECRIESLKAL